MDAIINREVDFFMAVWDKTALATQIENIETELAARVSGKPEQYSMENRSLRKTATEELIKLRDKLKREYDNLASAESIAAGTGNPNRFKVKFI